MPSVASCVRSSSAISSAVPVPCGAHGMLYRARRQGRRGYAAA